MAESNMKELITQLATANTEAKKTQAVQLKTDREMLEKMERELKEQGIEAKDNQKFRDAQLAQQKAEFDFRKSNAVGRAAQEEIKKEEQEAFGGYFERFLGKDSKLALGLQGIGKSFSNALGSAKSVLGTLLLAGGLAALSKFLQSEVWQDIKEVILDPSWPKFQELFKELALQFPIITSIITGIGIVGIVAVVTKLGTAFTALSSGFTALSAGIASIGAILGIGSAAAAGTVLAIVAGVVLVAKSLYDSFMVFSDTFKETGSILESLKEAGIEFVGTIVGLPFDLLKDLTSYLSRKLGFEGFADTLDSFSVEDIVKDAYRGFLNSLDKLGYLFIDAFTPSPEFLERLSEMNPINAVKKLIPLVKEAFTPSPEFLERLSQLNPFSFIKEQVDNVKNLFTGVFTWMGTSVSEGSEWLTTLVDKGLIAAYDVVKNIFSTENLTVENFTSMFGNLFDMVTAPIKFAFDSIKSIFMPIGDSETNELKKEYSLSSLLGNVVEDVFNWFKNLFKFDVSQISLPEFPDLGAIIVDIFRKFAGSIASIGFTIPFFGKVQLGDYLPQSFMDFAKETIEYKAMAEGVARARASYFDSIAPSVPVRPAASVTPTTAGEAGRGGSPIIINQSTQSNTRQGDQFSLSKGITDNSFGAQIANTFAQ